MNVNAQLNHARTLHQRGQLTKARVLFEKVLKVQPLNLDVLSSLAIIAAQSNDFQRAVQLFDQVVRLDPHNAAAYCNRGLALHELHEFGPALASFDRAIALKASYAVAYYNRGNSLQKLGESQGAIQSYDRAIAIDPGFAPAYYNRGVVLQHLEDWDGALANYQRAITLKPDYTEAHYNRAVTLQALGQWVAALAGYDQVIALDPKHAGAYSNRGVVLCSLAQSHAALDSFNRAIAIRPDYANAYFNRARTLNDLRQFTASVADYDSALALGSDGAGLFGSRRHAKMQICDWHDYAAETEELLLRIGHDEPASPPFHVLVVSDSTLLQRRAAEAWMRKLHPSCTKMPALVKSPRRGKIRIGYFSADFHDHATSYLMAQLFEEHDPSSFEINAFSFGPDNRDAMRSRIKSACRHFIDVRLRSDTEIAMLAREREIDVAVDLKGLTQFSRPGIFARRAAPVQVSYLGYPGTMGAAYIDYLVADRTLIPEGRESGYREHIIFMPDCYQVNDGRRIIADIRFSRDELGLPPSGFVFCCFNNNFKITPGTFDVWMRILQRVERAVLWLYQDNAIAATNLRREAAARGIDPSRLVFASFMPLPEHLARHRAADLFLDTAPYNAHTTASDALWAALPVLTCKGETFASRVAASLLATLDMPELITASYDEYEALAVALATQPERLAHIRQKLASHRLTAPLFNAPLFTRHLETAYRNVYERHQAGMPNASVFVSPE